jgi:excisionase family DNA binding protein
MADQRDKVFTSGEVAKICGVSPDTVSRWFDLGQLEGYRLGPGGDRRIPFDSLRQFMLNHGIPLDRLEEDQRRILVVDDDPYYIDVIPTALSNIGDFTIFTASTGFDAGALVAEHNPHLIILDIQLSDMDGRMVSERVKSRPDTRNTRILAISGYLADEDVDSLADYGFDDYLKKPFSLADLTDRVNALLGFGGAQKARSRA